MTEIYHSVKHVFSFPLTDRDGQIRSPQGLWNIAPPVSGARTATEEEEDSV